ncbi:Poly [ADP-ribose] polymerase 1 [Dionaea muscipula]
MANTGKPWKVEYAKSARATCRTCKSNIAKESLRFGKMVQSQQFDGFMPMWNHASCIMKKANQIKFIDDVDGIELLRWDDQEMIRKYVDSGSGGPAGTPNKSSTSAADYSVEVSQNSRAVCKHCSEKIMKAQVRISNKPVGQGTKGLGWYHAPCFMELFPLAQVDKLSGWDSLSSLEQASVISLAKGKAAVSEERGTAKRKSTSTDDKNVKVARTDGVGNSKEADLDSRLKAQTEELWALRDNLKMHVSTAELREMLEANCQESSGTELDLRERCADGMLFGALKRCPICSGHLHYSGGSYRCRGFISEWSKCSFSTMQPERVTGEWRIPKGTNNKYLCTWFKSQNQNKPVRIFPPASSNLPSKSHADNQSSSSIKDKKPGLTIAIAGVPKEPLEEFKRIIEAAGGQLHAKVKKDTSCLVVCGELDNQGAELKKARRMKIPIVREDYIGDCIERKKKLPFDLYKIEAIGETSSLTTVKVKGRSAVHESSGMHDTGHILEDGINIYNTTLNLSDLSTGVNSYYILQVIEDDDGSCCYVFRKWGRVGKDNIGGSKIDEMPKPDAVLEFKRLFREKTGNPWEAWVKRRDFQKQAGRFYPLDIDYGVNKHVLKKHTNNAQSRLAPALVELMKMLFNVETYRAAMMEFQINLSEMPLGKLSTTNIQKGFEALTQIQNLLMNHALDPSMKESLIVDASNRFFTIIPSIHPHVIKDEDDFKSKVKMLEALQDIEIASRLVGFDGDGEDSPLDAKYEKLRCEIAPLPHDSEDFQLIEKYLLTTHAPTHTTWSLELEEVFQLEREGESDKFAPHRAKLGNRMLLWHGSRLTNFVGILSQGLRIAPAEAPATGYMFGKGVYFADLVSKSAQYCYTDQSNPVGLMLLSEVALGEIYELTKAKYMDKPPRGKHSTKGLGKKVPAKSGFAKWRNEVVVPCGKPVDSDLKASELMYNEYIVYNTAQSLLSIFGAGFVRSHFGAD